LSIEHSTVRYTLIWIYKYIYLFKPK
jgi:hypothetical protein